MNPVFPLIIAHKNIKKLKAKILKAHFPTAPDYQFNQWTTGETPPRFCTKVMPSNLDGTGVPMTPRVWRSNQSIARSLAR